MSTRLQQRRLIFAGHCWRSQESAIQPVSDLLFWTVPAGGEYKRGKGNCTTYIDTLLKDHAGEKIRKKDHIVAVSNLTTAMEDRDTWKILLRTFLRMTRVSYLMNQRRSRSSSMGMYIGMAISLLSYFFTSYTHKKR